MDTNFDLFARNLAGFPWSAFIQVGLCYVGWKFSDIWYHHNCGWKMMGNVCTEVHGHSGENPDDFT